MQFLNGDLVACLDEGVVVCLDNNNKDYFYLDIRHNLDEYFEIFSSHTPWNSLLKNLGTPMYITPWIYEERWLV